jgi:REP-associated tyrosine transposase
MAIPARNSRPSAVISSERTFFVTSSISGKRRLLQSERSAELFRQVIYGYRDQGKFLLHDFVIMPEHVHLLMTVDSNISIERAVQFVKGGFAYQAGKELGFRAPVWQKGFSEIRVLDEPSFLRFREYIRNNPVRQHLVKDVQEYRYSSAFAGSVLDPMPQRLKPCFFSCLSGASKDAP